MLARPASRDVPLPVWLRRPLWWVPAIAATVLVLLIEQVLAGGAVLGGDAALHAAAVHNAQPSLRMVASAVTTLGDYPTAVPVLLLIAAVVSARRRTMSPLLLAVTALVALGVGLAALKLGVGRSGPPAPVTAVWDGGKAFPCGPPATIAVAGAVLGLLIRPSTRGRVWRRRVFGATGLVSAAVGVSWVYLGTHWPTDVVAAWALAVLVIWSVASLGLLPRGDSPAAIEPQSARDQFSGGSPHRHFATRGP